MENKSTRLLSLDTLRGFDMLFIMGFSGLVAAVCALWPGTFSDWLAATMGHKPWDGWTHHDTIFPLFLFIAGVSFPFSLAKQQEKGLSRGHIYWKVISRGVILVLLGCVYNGFFKLSFPFRYASVLARIGLAWMFAALMFMNLKTWARAIVAVAILLGYWALMALVVAPDAPAGASPFSVEGNLAGYVDRMLLPGRLHAGTYDPEGILGLLPSIVTAMLGMFTGEFVRLPKERISGERKSLYMFLAALALLGVGTLWNQLLPINKTLWSSSFVCVVGGYSLGMFSLFYYIIDVKGYKRWTLFFRVIGLNSITIYLAQRIVDFGKISKFFLGGVAGLCPDNIAAVINGIGYVAVCWLFLYFLYKKNIFLKV